ncbi:hypothetical protein HPB50_029642 [Hyalomma asiaticum]|nr:hypothetical protein HPB50_029642 [Hyalomma asiaticum]
MVLKIFRQQKKTAKDAAEKEGVVTDTVPQRVARPSMVQLEFELLTGVPVLRSLEQALDQAKEKVVQAARQKRHLEGFLEDLDACLSGTSEATVYEATITAAICLIPGLLKERRESFVCDFDPTAVHYTPMVVHQGNVLRTTDFTACLEDIRIPEKSLLAALASQMSLYWAFNIVFFKKSSRTFDLLCRLIKVESGLRPTPLDPTAVHSTPMVVHQGNVLRTADFTACLEDIRIPEKSLLAALASQMPLNWTFNIVFFKKSSRNFDLLCRLIKVESGLRPTPLVRMAQTVLEK